MARIRLIAQHTVYAGKAGTDPVQPGGAFTVDSAEEADALVARGVAKRPDVEAAAKLAGDAAPE